MWVGTDVYIESAYVMCSRYKSYIGTNKKTEYLNVNYI